MGVDFSGEMIRQTRIKHPEIHFIQADAHDLKISQKFDFIVLSDLLNDLWDIHAGYWHHVNW